MIGAAIGGQVIAGPSGPGTLVGVNVLPATTPVTGTAATVNLLTGDGTVAAIALPTTGAQVEQALAPVGNLAGVLLGEQAGGAVSQLTQGLAPTVATVTATVDQVATPLLGAVNGALAPVTQPLVGEGGVLAPVTGLVNAVTGGLTGGAPSEAFAGPLIGADLSGQVVTGASTTDTLVGVNLLPSTGAGVEGQLVTANVLTQGTLVDVAVPTTAAGVEAGLQPVGNLAGAVLGPQAGAAVNQVSAAVAPAVAAVTGVVDAVVSPVLDAVNSATPALPGAGSGTSSPLAPVTGVVGSVLAPVTSGSQGSTPLGGLLGGLLGR